MKIKRVHGRQIFDSRGNPTVEADVWLESGITGRAAVPSGASVGAHEAVELRDNDAKMYGGKGVGKAVANINGEIAVLIVGLHAEDQEQIDRLMIGLDGTSNKSRLGANAILAVSLACFDGAAKEAGLPRYAYAAKLAGKTSEYVLPIPMLNVINGGKHGSGSIDIQEYMIIPVGAKSFGETIRMGAEVFYCLRDVLRSYAYDTTVGDEGGFSPHIRQGNKEALDLLSEAVERAGYSLGSDIAFGLDIAASELYKDGYYNLRAENRRLTTDEMISWLSTLAYSYPIVSIEDGMAENDWAGWVKLTERLGAKLQLVADDLLVTNVALLERAIKEKAGNAILIKPNQVGTLTETIAAVRMAQDNFWPCIMSHRSGETEDTTISHLAVGLATGQIKAGSLSRTDRTVKYNELLRIEEMLADTARLAPPVYGLRWPR